MATISEIRNCIEKAEKEHKEMKEMLERLDNLRKRKVEEDYVGERQDLEGKEKMLERGKEKWGDQVVELQKALVGFGKGEGNCIRKNIQKIIFHSFHFFLYL